MFKVEKLSTTADFSEASLEDAWKQAKEPRDFCLVLGVLDGKQPEIVFQGRKIPFCVNPAWQVAWLLCAKHVHIFSPDW